jgi:hypothetical protein
VSVKKPQLAALRSIGALVLFLSVYAAQSAPTDVYGPYNTVSYLALALSIGWACSHLFWPGTASALLRSKSATQLELCQSVTQALSATADARTRREHIAQRLQRYGIQLASLATLHSQAEHEPIERALDASRRAALLAVTQDLFDAAIAAQARIPWEMAPSDNRTGPDVEALREAFLREDDALDASLQGVVEALRGSAAQPSAELSEAHGRVMELIDGLRNHEDSRQPASSPDRTAFLEQLDRRHQLITRQLALEEWLSEWRTAEGL